MPPIVGVVVHHGETGWSCARSMHEIVDGIQGHPELARFVPSFRFQLDDLGRSDDASLVHRPMPTFARVVLWLLRDGRNIARLLEGLPVWGPLLNELASRDPYGADLVSIVTYVLRVAGEPYAERLIRRRIVEAAPRLENTMRSAADQLIEQGLERGLEKGRAEGRRARIRTLVRLLTKRFGSLSSEQTERIEAGTNEQLEAWTERILDASSVDETLAD